MYVYAADTWCDACGEDLRRTIARAEGLSVDECEERYPDSDQFPHWAPEQETDGPDHCASVGDCLSPDRVDLTHWGLAEGAPLYGAESRTIGALLSDSLTHEGVRYLVGDLLASHDRLGGPTPYQAALYAYWREVFAEEIDYCEEVSQ